MVTKEKTAKGKEVKAQLAKPKDKSDAKKPVEIKPNIGLEQQNKIAQRAQDDLEIRKLIKELDELEGEKSRVNADYSNRIKEKWDKIKALASEDPNQQKLPFVNSEIPYGKLTAQEKIAVANAIGVEVERYRNIKVGVDVKVIRGLFPTVPKATILYILKQKSFKQQGAGSDIFIFTQPKPNQAKKPVKRESKKGGKNG